MQALENALRALIAVAAVLGRVACWYYGHARDVFGSLTGR